MKERSKKIIIIAIGTVVIIAVLTVIIFINTGFSGSFYDNSQSQYGSDIIVWKYRSLSDGTVQRRMWNQTKGIWAEENWNTNIDIFNDKY